MAEQRSTIVQPAAAPNKSKGARRDANLRAAFPESPIYKNDITDEERRKAYQELALDGVVNSGNGINSFDRDFKGTTQNPVPNLEDVETGSVNAADMPEYAGELPSEEFINEFGSGMGGLISPSQTSAEISKQGTLGTYISGRSYQGSDGKA